MDTEIVSDFSVGRVLSRSISIWLSNFVSFTVLALLCYSPVILLSLVMSAGELTLETYKSWDRIDNILQVLPQYILTGAVTFGAFRQLKGEHVGFGEIVGVGLKRMLPALGVAIVVGLVTGLAMLLLVVPGLICAAMFYVAVPAAVIERTGVGASMTRSSDLTRGYRWRTFGIILVVGLMSIAAVLPLTLLLVGQATSIDSLKLFMIIINPVVAVVGTFGAVVSAVSYYELRRAKEGIDIDQLVQVFD